MGPWPQAAEVRNLTVFRSEIQWVDGKMRPGDAVSCIAFRNKDPGPNILQKNSQKYYENVNLNITSLHPKIDIHHHIKRSSTSSVLAEVLLDGLCLHELFMFRLAPGRWLDHRLSLGIHRCTASQCWVQLHISEKALLNSWGVKCKLYQLGQLQDFVH